MHQTANVILYSRNDALLIFRRNIYAVMHQHHGMQITLGTEGEFEAVLDQQQSRHRVLVIDSDYPHRVVGQDAWIATLLLNPETALTKAIRAHVLQGKAYRSLSVPIPLDLGLPEDADECAPLDRYLTAVRTMLLPDSTEELTLEPRIEQALEIVHQQLDYKIAAKDLSEQIHLSESRLGHLFKAEVGIPLRRYLLWSRLLLAAQIIARGESFTFAAHETGFTDSPHLSRTFARMFGLRISDMFGDREAVRVYFCK